jgi:DNA recombination-dependent growth factor C
MLVGRGALTFRTYRVTGKNATPSAEAIAEKLGQFKFTGLGSADEGSATGWVAPDHLFDGDFDPIKMGRGHYLCFALRIDTRRVPGPILAAHIALEEKAWKDANGADKVPGAKRREIKKSIKAKLLEETPPTQRAFGVFWRVKSKKLFFQSTSKNANNELVELFARTFDLGLEAQLPGLVAHEVAEENGRLSALGDATPLKLTENPVAVEA